MSFTSVGIDEGGDRFVAIDRISGVDYQRVKLVVNEADSTAAVPSDATKGLAVFRGDVVSTYHKVSVGTSADAVNIKASSGYLKAVHVFNIAAAPVYVKLHNSAVTPTAGSGVVLTVAAQAGVARDMVLKGRGRQFATGIALTIVTGLADNSTTAVNADEVIVEVQYE